MANKAFEIQNSTLRIGGVEIEAGSTTIVIPGVTQASNYFVEEVDDQDGSNPDIFGSDPDAVTVIDNAEYLYRSGIETASGSYSEAGYSVDELDDGEIDGINIELIGTFLDSDKVLALSENMWATTAADPYTNFDTNDWTQIPFKPKMRAGEVENLGGGADLGSFTFDGNQLEVESGTDIYIATFETGGPGESRLVLKPQDDDEGQNPTRIEGSYGVGIWSNTTDTAKEWLFGIDGKLKLPSGGDIINSAGVSVLSVDDSNIWIQTFETVDGAPADVVPLAISVEYDDVGNIIALFSHTTDTNGSYYSVGKFTTTGNKIWSARFVDGFNTDGWGLAVDKNSGWIYVAGKTSPEIGTSVSTLTKINLDDGSVDWSKTYDFDYESSSAVVDVASDDNPVMVGYASNGLDRYVTTTKVDASDGSIIWTRKLDGQGNEEAYGMAVGPDGEIVTIGYMDQLGLGSANSAATLAASPSSNVNWVTPITVSAPSGVSFNITLDAGVATLTVTLDTVGGRSVDDVITNVLGSALGGTDGIDDMTVTVASVSSDPGSQDDHMLVVKYNSSGVIQWQKAILFDTGFNCAGADADIDSSGNIYVTGQYSYTLDPGTASALSILKLDSAGTKQWSRRIVGDCDTFGTSVVVGPDDKLYMSGITATANQNDFLMVAGKFGFDGALEWQRLVDNTTTWVFAGGIFFSEGGGSNIAVKEDYVVLSGGFGDEGNTPQSVLLQVATTGDVFSVGDWDFKAATFTGSLDDTASDITVLDANKTDSDNALTITTNTATLMNEVADFLIGTLYTTGGNDRLVSGSSELVLDSAGTLTLPSGGTITEGLVTSNPTIQLTPATPTAISQKLVVKGGGTYQVDANGISLNLSNIVYQVSDTVTAYIYSPDNSNQSLYWWIVPSEAGISDPGFGTVEIDGSGSGTITFTLDSDDYEFTIRVSPTDNVYIPESTGVESLLVNGDAPTFGDHHLHLTTGDLTETSIFLGTDTHNVRTTTNGNIEITTPTEGTNVWEFNTSGMLTVPSSLGPNIYNLYGVGIGTSYNGYEVEFTGYIDDGSIGNSGATLHVTSIISGAITDGMTVYGDGLPPEGWVLTFGSAVEPAGSGSTGNYVLDGANYLISSQSFNNNVSVTAKAWLFDSDGGTTFPTLTVPISDNAIPNGTGQTLKFSDSSQQAIIYGPSATTSYINAERVIIQGAPGYTGTAGEGGDVYLWAGPGGDTGGDGGDIKVRAGQGILTGAGGYLNFQSGDSGTGYGGYINIESGETSTYGDGGYITVQARSGGNIILRTYNSEGNSRELVLNNQGTTILPGAVVKSTLAKTGIDPVTFGLGRAATVTASPSNNTNLTVGTVNDIVFASGFTLNVTVAENGDISTEVTASDQTQSVGSFGVILGGGSLGGTTPADDITFTVASLTDVISPTPLDLTKSINKLTDGLYSLANGTEGQIMYLVRQTGSTNAVFVLIDNSRESGIVYTDTSHAPFSGGSSENITTLIFTDGAWQSNNGSWI